MANRKVKELRWQESSIGDPIGHYVRQGGRLVVGRHLHPPDEYDLAFRDTDKRIILLPIPW
jgi:hypothetical protein